MNAQTRLHWLEDECQRLQTHYVDKLPKTADGVPVVPGMRVWLIEHQTTLGHIVSAVGIQDRKLPKIWLEDKGCVYHGQDIASTREAADERTR